MDFWTRLRRRKVVQWGLVYVAGSWGFLRGLRKLLDLSEVAIREVARLGAYGYGVSDVQVLALRGAKREALEALLHAQQPGWRGPLWRYYRDFDANLASIRDESQFKAIFADIERDMAQQRARLAACPKDAPLELTEASR